MEIAARTNEPHRIAFYLYELSSDLHALYNKGNDVPGLRFLQEGNTDATQAKIALARAVSVVISAGLGILGVTPVEEMRWQQAPPSWVKAKSKKPPGGVGTAGR